MLGVKAWPGSDGERGERGGAGKQNEWQISEFRISEAGDLRMGVESAHVHIPETRSGVRAREHGDFENPIALRTGLGGLGGCVAAWGGC